MTHPDLAPPSDPWTPPPYDEPRIVAQGRWEQDDAGSITYTPDHLRPWMGDEDGPDDPPDDRHDDPPGDSPGPAPRPHAPADAGYRIRSDETWDAARRDYLAGDSAPAVCRRYDLALGTFRHRSAHEGWRRSDAPDPEPVDLAAERAAGLPDLAEMAANALVRANRAILSGRAAEAASWLRIHRKLSAPPAETRPAQPPPAPPPARAAPDPLAGLEQDLKEITAIAEAAYALDDDDLEGRAAVEARLAALEARPLPGAISDDSDDSDRVFSPPQSETAPTAPEPP